MLMEMGSSIYSLPGSEFRLLETLSVSLSGSRILAQHHRHQVSGNGNTSHRSLEDQMSILRRKLLRFATLTVPSTASLSLGNCGLRGSCFTMFLMCLEHGLILQISSLLLWMLHQDNLSRPDLMTSITMGFLKFLPARMTQKRRWDTSGAITSWGMGAGREPL